MSEQVPSSSVQATPLFDQAMELWVRPEIARRSATGTLPDGFRVERFQIVMHVDQPHQVRLNDEIRGLMQVRVNQAVQAGAQVHFDQIDDIVGFDVTKSDPNAGHLTALLVPRGNESHWALFFDFRYNSHRVKETLEIANEFLFVAESALGTARIRATAENLFTAFELGAKALLLLLPDRRVLDARSHGTVGGLFNVFSRHGNVDTEITRGFRRASALRPGARYSNRTFETNVEELTQLLSIAKRFLADVALRNRRLPDEIGAPGARDQSELDR
ncbi:MAG: HEPN domain-containing protein [Archangium sp.]|nr:HEPN domain-containing protein [Archangium sp.]